MPQIKVPPEELMQDAGIFRQAAAEADEIVSNVSSVVAAVEPGWQGAARTIFDATFPGWKSGMMQISLVYQSVATELDQTAQRFLVNDDAAARAIQNAAPTATPTVGGQP